MCVCGSDVPLVCGVTWYCASVFPGKSNFLEGVRLIDLCHQRYDAEQGKRLCNVCLSRKFLIQCNVVMDTLLGISRVFALCTMRLTFDLDIDL